MRLRFSPFSASGNRGVIPVAIIYVLCGLGVITVAVPNFRPWNWFQKGPPTIELSKAETALATAKADAAKAQADLVAAQAKERAATVEQVRYSQQMIAGVPAALKRAPASPEVSLASQLAERAGKGLSAAIGDLPADRQAEILAIVEGALSAKQAEVDAAKAALASKDAELAATTAAKAQVEAQIPVLTAKAVNADSKAAAAESLVTAKTNEVAAWADKKAASDKEAGSLGALVKRLEWWIVVAAMIYLFIHFAMPSLAAEFPACKALTVAYRGITSIASSHIVQAGEAEVKAAVQSEVAKL